MEELRAPGNLSVRLARHAADLSMRDVPVHAIAAARMSLVDAIAVSAAASGMVPACRVFLDIARDMGTGPSVAIGYGTRLSAPMAAWVNGALAHAIDYEDTHDHAIAHPHAAAVAAALAIAETRSDPVTGVELLAALAVSGDVVCRIAASFTEPPDRNGWHTTPWLGVFGAATAAGRLLRLDVQGMVDAWSLAMSQMCSFGELKHSPLSDVRAVRDAFAAKAGVLGAMLAMRGVRGFDDPLAGPAGFIQAIARGHFDEDLLLDGLGHRFMGTQVSFKPWPSCRGTHAYIEAGLNLHRRPGITATDITDIEVTVNEKNLMLCEPAAAKAAPDRAIGAKFSIPYTLSSALVHGRVTLGTFSDAALADPAVLALAARVRYRVDPALPLRATTTGAVSIICGGMRHVEQINVALGHPDRPLTEQQSREKFDDCMARADLPEYGARASILWAALETLATRSDVRLVTAQLAATADATGTMTPGPSDRAGR